MHAMLSHQAPERSSGLGTVTDSLFEKLAQLRDILLGSLMLSAGG